MLNAQVKVNGINFSNFTMFKIVSFLSVEEMLYLDPNDLSNE